MKQKDSGQRRPSSSPNSITAYKSHVKAVTHAARIKKNEWKKIKMKWKNPAQIFLWSL